ncbi:uncharacterized protein VP01_158g12 [Puccinia sorghi]|uniref:Uncharacterized protein n=1 Tax=Puccinia sorghi TaxID=27349 RepID=A0A0L6VHL1_9BASI|nr:uncharacterized protein VP01_158g12 [Puccinia sorghi]
MESNKKSDEDIDKLGSREINDSKLKKNYQGNQKDCQPSGQMSKQGRPVNKNNSKEVILEEYEHVSSPEYDRISRSPGMNWSCTYKCHNLTQMCERHLDSKYKSVQASLKIPEICINFHRSSTFGPAHSSLTLPQYLPPVIPTSFQPSKLIQVSLSLPLLCVKTAITGGEIDHFSLQNWTQNSNRQSQDIFQHSGQTISKYLNGFPKYTGTLAQISENIPLPLKSTFFIFSHPSFSPCHKTAAYRSCKEFLSQIFMAYCNLNMNFTYLFVGWEEKAHNARVLNDTQLADLPIPHCHFYLADVIYRLDWSKQKLVKVLFNITSKLDCLIWDIKLNINTKQLIYCLNQKSRIQKHLSKILRKFNSNQEQCQIGMWQKYVATV